MKTYRNKDKNHIDAIIDVMMNLQEKMMQEQIVFVTNISQCYNCLKLLWEQIFFVANITEGTVIRGVEGPKVLATPPTAHTNISFPLL